ncbi:hypothetical protein OG223_27550 [Streptomyces sp. NBC_01478]|uniref:hypothetical protein n=1 Tax=Streptomyces sp. NBC_01478 TaxID=2903882 RepID=UPI002E322FCE|nr:hypothetical protein [Streptomyces sp. NBC_01478]
MDSDEIETRELYDQTAIAAEELTDPEYTRGLRTLAAWKSGALRLAHLWKGLDAALTEGGDIPIEWIIGDLPEEVPKQ